ncbi:MAG: ABC transporter substrate-binding protein, partial [Clostridia bacterium]|nr:ABC transporter substrate-binding protein [Clostridia bacterium]
EEAAQWIADLGIVAKAALAQKALPACNIVYIDGEEMMTAVSGYLAVLFDQNPEAVGGQLPDEAFYYLP